MLQSRGITDLISAEKEAQGRIEEARKRKNKRLKEAQNEAKTEIEHFKGDRDQRYKSLEQQVGSIELSISLSTRLCSNWVIEIK